MTYDEIKTNYSDPLTLENVRVILKISKRKAAWLLQNQYIKCIDTGKNTRRYTIKIDDLIEYMQNVESGELIVPTVSGMFNAHDAKSHLDSTVFPKNLPDDFEKWLEKKWENQSGALTIKDITELTGYSQRSIVRWLAEGRISRVIIPDGFVIPKKYVINYLSGDGYKITQKSYKHIILLKKYFGI